MDGEVPYLRKRARFHRRMARQAAGGEARCAHDAFVRAYQGRIEELTCGGHPAARGADPGLGAARRPRPLPVQGG